MARPLRIEYPGALYHVIARGNSSQNIFLHDIDRKKFLFWIRDTVEMHNLVVHAYCLMDNHYHLLIETLDANLSKAMRDLNGHYSQWFNFTHGRVGHLFQGRYKAFLIEKDTYLLEVARYIVLNPVRAGIVNHPKLWKWSSYPYTAGFLNTPTWLHTDWILNFFGNEIVKSKKLYNKFIIDGFSICDPHMEAKNRFILGSPQFIDWVWATHTNGSEILKEYPRDQRIVGRPTLDELFEDVNTKEERNATIKLARIRCGYPATEIAEYVNLHPSVVGRICRDKYNKVSNKT